MTGYNDPIGYNAAIPYNGATSPPPPPPSPSSGGSAVLRPRKSGGAVPAFASVERTDKANGTPAYAGV